MDYTIVSADRLSPDGIVSAARLTPVLHSHPSISVCLLLKKKREIEQNPQATHSPLLSVFPCFLLLWLNTTDQVDCEEHKLIGLLFWRLTPTPRDSLLTVSSPDTGHYIVRQQVCQQELNFISKPLPQ